MRFGFLLAVRINLRPWARARVLFTRALRYYRHFGLSKTLDKLRRRLAGRDTSTGATEVHGSTFRAGRADQVTVPFSLTGVEPCDALVSGHLLVQEIQHDLDAVDRADVLLANLGRCTTSTNFIALFSERGELLVEHQFSSTELADQQFFPVTVPAREDQAAGNTLYVVLGSVDGTPRNCITAWRTVDPRAGELFRVSAATAGEFPALLARRHDPELWARRQGQMVYRLGGRRNLTSIRYRQPAVRHRLDRLAQVSVPHVLLFEESEVGSNAVALDGSVCRAAALARRRVQCRSAAEALDALAARDIDLVLICAAAAGDGAREIQAAAAKSYLPTLFLGDDALLSGARSTSRDYEGQPSKVYARLASDLCACDFVLGAGERARALASAYGKQLISCPEPTQLDDATWKAIRTAYLRRHRPLVSIVSLLCGKSREVAPALRSYLGQTYDGDFEIIFVDDQSPDGSSSVLQEMGCARASGEFKRIPEVRIIQNPSDLGNCGFRNAGIAAARGDIVVLIDADCMMNADFIRRHVEAHAFDDCTAVIGPMDIETSGRDPLTLLAEYERAPRQAVQDAVLRDPLNRTSFLNCNTRNFSIKASAIRGQLFDPLLACSTDPRSGIESQDVDMGYGLYQSGARIKFAEDAFSIHISPSALGDQSSKAYQSLRNFRRLFDKHPDLILAARRWALTTYQGIRDRMASEGLEHNEDNRFMDGLMRESGAMPVIAPGARRHRILTYRWHVPHQYELYKLPHEFTLVTDLGSPMTNGWDLGQRPLPANSRFLEATEVDPRDYDLAILHFDENVLSHENTNGFVGPEWGRAFRWFREHLPLPKIAICHGTPQFYGQYDIDYTGPRLMQAIEPARLRMVEYVGDMPVVVNSHQACQEWRFRNARVIWHGFDPAEFPAATYERGILSPMGPLVVSRPHYRGYFIYRKVFEDFPAAFLPDTLRVPEPHPLYVGNTYATGKYQNYVDEIRRYSVYFNPTLRSPMPRARAEPMMCGVVPVSAHNHDVDMFIINGRNGFYSKDPGELREQLLYLVRKPEQTRKMGAEARRTAMNLFNHDRYLAEWQRLIRETVG